MAAAKQLISKYYPWPIEREQGADFDGQQTSNNRFSIDGEGGANVWKTLQEWEDEIGRVHTKWLEFIVEDVLLIEIHPLYIYKASCATELSFENILQ